MSAIRYKAITSAKDADGNLTYNGKTYGVRFENGIAFFDDVTVDKKLGVSAAEIADKMEREFGYEVQKLNPDGTPYAPPPTPPQVEESEVPTKPMGQPVKSKK